MIYTWLKIFHLTVVTISIAGFFVRGILLLSKSHWLAHKWIKVLPHMIDTFLLLSGIGLIVLTQQSPLQTPWLGLKLMLVVVYIVLGIFAFRIAQRDSHRLLGWLAALLVASLVVYIARSHQIPGF